MKKLLLGILLIFATASIALGEDAPVFTDSDLGRYQAETSGAVSGIDEIKNIVSQRDQERNASCAQMAQEINNLPRGFFSSLYGISRAKIYNCQCIQKLDNCHLVSPADDSQYKYQGASGKKYKYDLSKPGDRLQYETDPAAKINDSIDPDPRKNLDRGLGEYGGGGK